MPSDLSTYGESCGSIEDPNWLEDIKKYGHRLPAHLRIGYYDVVVLYCEQDANDATEFCQHLKEDVNLGEYGSIKVRLYDDVDFQILSSFQIEQLTHAVDRTTYVFVFVTQNYVKNFNRDRWINFCTQCCLMNSLTNELKEHCVIPVLTEAKSDAFKVPFELGAYTGLKYYRRDDFYKRCVTKLIESKVQIRLDHERNQKKERRRMIEEWERQNDMNDNALKKDCSNSDLSSVSDGSLELDGEPSSSASDSGENGGISRQAECQITVAKDRGNPTSSQPIASVKPTIQPHENDTTSKVQHVVDESDICDKGMYVVDSSMDTDENRSSEALLSRSELDGDSQNDSIEANVPRPDSIGDQASGVTKPGPSSSARCWFLSGFNDLITMANDMLNESLN